VTDQERFARSIAEAQDRILSTGPQLAQAREKLISTMAAPPVRRARAPWIVASGLTFAAALSVLLLIAFRRNGSPLQVTVGPNQHRADLGSFIAASPTESLPIGFSDGSSLMLAPASAARVTETYRHGAHVVLESGHLAVQVVHRAETEWHLRAGPFDVQVTGTRFDLEWKNSVGELDLAMQEGRVIVTGGCLARPQELATGEHLTASTLTSRWEVSSGGSVVAASTTALAPAPTAQLAETPPSDLSPPAEIAPSADTRTPLGNAEAAPSRLESWRDSLSRGEYREAVAMLDENAWTQAVQSASASDLLALANAARLSDDFTHASQSLLGLRRRFPRDGRAKVAAFTLGRIAFDHGHAYGDAATWFRRYLAEAPGGNLAREASGRLIEAYQLSGNHVEANDAARRYLREYPTGPHADLARHELSQP
jgi:transmembrane sensor